MMSAGDHAARPLTDEVSALLSHCQLPGPAIANSVLLKLPKLVQNLVQAGKLTQSHGAALYAACLGTGGGLPKGPQRTFNEGGTPNLMTPETGDGASQSR
jgi:hypothetical protein